MNILQECVKSDNHFEVQLVQATGTRPGKSGGSWDLRSKKIFGLQESFQTKSHNIVENLENYTKKYLRKTSNNFFEYKIFFERALHTKFSMKGCCIQNFL